VIHGPASSSMLSFAKSFDEDHAGIPILQTLVKGFVLRGSTDTDLAKLTINLGEAIRLTREQEDLQQRLKGVKDKIRLSAVERRDLRSTDSFKNPNFLMEALDSPGADKEWKKKGHDLVARALDKAGDHRAAATQELERIMERMMELAEKVKLLEAIQAAKEAAMSGVEQARSHADAGMAYAQSGEMQAQLAGTMSRAREVGSSSMAQAQQQLQTGVAYAQSGEMQATFASAREMAGGHAQRVQASIQQSAAYAQSAEARAAVLGQAQARHLHLVFL